MVEKSNYRGGGSHGRLKGACKVIKVGIMINRGKWDDQGVASGMIEKGHLDDQLGTSGRIKVGHKMIKRGTYGMIRGTSGMTQGSHLGSSVGDIWNDQGGTIKMIKRGTYEMTKGGHMR